MRLAEHNRVIVTDLFRPGLTYVETTWLETKKRGQKKLWVEASYCPFCGAKYPERQKPEASE